MSRLKRKAALFGRRHSPPSVCPQKARKGEKPAKGGHSDVGYRHRTRAENSFCSYPEPLWGCSEDHDPRTDWDYFFLRVNMFCTSKTLCKPGCQICQGEPHLYKSLLKIIVKKNNHDKESDQFNSFFCWSQFVNTDRDKLVL